jgi:fructoselysine-6-P-deglycase FrlB-like protein
MELLHLAIRIPEGAYFRNLPVADAQDTNSHDRELPAAELCAFEASEARATTGEAIDDSIAFGDVLLDDVVQVGKGISDHEKKPLQAIHAIDCNERTTVSYIRVKNLVGYAEVALVEELLEIAASQCFVHFQ